MRLMRSGPLSQQPCEGQFIIFFLLFLFVLVRNEIISAQCWQEEEIRCGFYWSYVRQTFILSCCLLLHFLFPTSYEVVNFLHFQNNKTGKAYGSFLKKVQGFIDFTLVDCETILLSVNNDLTENFFNDSVVHSLMKISHS